MNQGHQIYFATGRDMSQVEPIIKKYNFMPSGIIYLNGNIYPNPPKTLEKSPLYDELSLMFKKSKEVGIYSHTNIGLLQKGSIKVIIKQFIKKLIHYGNYQDLHLCLSFKQDIDIYKIDITGSNAVLKPILKHWQNKYPQYKIVFGSTTNIEITPHDIHKLQGVLTIKEQLGLDDDHIYVFGDSENDVTMLKHFKHSYAPSNALENALLAANHTCDLCTNDGVAKVIEEVLRKEN